MRRQLDLLNSSHPIASPRVAPLSGRVVKGSGPMAPRRSTSSATERQRNLLLQPQDGALDVAQPVLSLFGTTGKLPPVTAGRPSFTTISRHDHLLSEPEDAKLTGGTRSLMRRVLGLNVTDALRKPAATTKTKIFATRQIA
jgi:hypothetical protein